jgi:hypothetical protein
MPLAVWEQLLNSLERQEQRICVAEGLQARTRQKIRANHLRTVTTRLLTTEDQRNGLECLLDHRQLAFLNLEVKLVPWLRSFTCEASLHFPFEFTLGISFALCIHGAQSKFCLSACTTRTNSQAFVHAISIRSQWVSPGSCS